MQALILEEIGSLKLKEAAIPVPEGGDVLIRVKAATTCGTDVKAYRRGHPQIPMPGPLGHEYSGVVEAVGPRATFKPGDPVMGVHSAPCRACKWCLAGQDNLCESIMETKVLGSFAEYLLIPERIASLNLFKKPSNLSFEVAALLEPLACVAQGIIELRKMEALAATDALVIGPGAIGLMFVAALKASGVPNVVLAGRNEQRLNVGEVLGATVTRYPEVAIRPQAGFDIVVECTGQVEVWEKSVDFARRGGVVMLFGGCPSGTQARFDTARLHYDQITLVSPFHFGTGAVRLARQWLANGKVNFSVLISGSRSLCEATETFQYLIEGRGIKYAFTP